MERQTCMTSRLDMTKAIALGLVLGIIFAILQVSASRRLSDEVLVVTYAAVLILAIIVFVPSVISGLLSALAAIICQSVVEFLYYSYVYGADVAAGMMPYSLFLLPAAQLRLVALPLSGMLGGAIAAEFSPKSKTARKSRRGKGKRKMGHGTG